MKHLAGFAAVAGLCTVVTACSSASSSQPSSAAGPTTVLPTTVPPTTVPTTANPATPVPTDAPVPTAVARPTQSSVAAPTQASTTTASAVRLVLDASASQASYHAHEQLVGKSLPSEAVGTSSGVSGGLVVGADGSIAADQSTITVDLTQLKSDESRRDNFSKTNTLETSKYPTATFVATAVQGLPIPLPPAGSATFQLLGNLTVHGVTKPVTWQVTAQFADTSVTGSATTNVNITDFGMTPPKAGPVLSIEDALTLELTFTATRAA